MKKPIIVLADTDENYLAPLEEKFIDETGDHIDLEIITDPLFFNEYFSQPQKIDILVISEDLYRTDLHRLNIRYIFLLTEEPDEGGTDDLRCHSIYKYTSTKEIYHRIVSVAAELLESEFDKPSARLPSPSASAPVWRKVTSAFSTSTRSDSAHSNTVLTIAPSFPPTSGPSSPPEGMIFSTKSRPPCARKNSTICRPRAPRFPR